MTEGPALPAVIPCCYPDECWAFYLHPGDVGFGPCWGQSTAIDEDWGDWGHDFIHGCEGHPDRDGAYVPPAEG